MVMREIYEYRTLTRVVLRERSTGAVVMLPLYFGASLVYIPGHWDCKVSVGGVKTWKESGGTCECRNLTRLLIRELY